MRSLAFAAPIAVLALVVAGIVFEHAGQRKDRSQYPQIGRSVDIGGRTLNIYCSGEGGPAVIFDTYGHMSGYAWSAVQSQVAKFRTACWYDRAAYGWSDPAPMPRTFQSVASDLHKLLHAAAVPPPYVFIGGGDAALHIRVYYGFYPNEVAGVVMVDANDVDIPRTNLPEAAKGPWAKHFGSFAPRVRGAACSVFPIMNGVGVGHLAASFQTPRHTDSIGLTEQQQAELDFLSDNPTAQGGSELCTRDEDMEQVRAAGDLGTIPLEVIASRRLVSESNLAERAIELAWEKRRLDRVQPGLARLSPQSRLVVVDGGVDAKTIAQAVRDVIDVRKGR